MVIVATPISSSISERTACDIAAYDDRSDRTAMHFAAAVAEMGLEGQPHLRAPVFKAVEGKTKMDVQRYRGTPLRRG